MRDPLCGLKGEVIIHEAAFDEGVADLQASTPDAKAWTSLMAFAQPVPSDGEDAHG